MASSWILVADASRARVLAGDRRLRDVVLVEEIDHAAGRLRASDLTTDGAGRSAGARGTAPSAMDAHTDPAAVEHDAFARALVERVATAFGAGQFQQLVIVAPPRFLGLLRRHLPPALADRVVATLDRDLTQVPVHDLSDRLANVLPA